MMSLPSRDPLFNSPSESPSEAQHAREPLEAYRYVASRAAIYALILRAEGYTPAEAAEIVVRRYPSVRPKLRKFLHREESSSNGSFHG